MRLKVQDERWAEARERSRAEREREESSATICERTEWREHARNTSLYRPRGEANERVEMHGWTGNARVNNLLQYSIIQNLNKFRKLAWGDKSPSWGVGWRLPPAPPTAGYGPDSYNRRSWIILDYLLISIEIWSNLYVFSTIQILGIKFM